MEQDYSIPVGFVTACMMIATGHFVGNVYLKYAGYVYFWMVLLVPFVETMRR
jgi:hypothetical protein